MTTDEVMHSVQSELGAMLERLDRLTSDVAIATSEATDRHAKLTFDTDIANASDLKAERSAERNLWSLRSVHEAVRAAASGVAASQRMVADCCESARL